tara:strand:- start:227 stop:382 length:156 start_codon:yes stop_codon:yes gene_type:complete
MIGNLSVKEKEQKKKNELIENAKNQNFYKEMIKKFPDADLVNIKLESSNEE